MRFPAMIISLRHNFLKTSHIVSSLPSVQHARTFSRTTMVFKYDQTKRRPRDKEINSQIVQLVDSEGRLCSPEPLQDVLGRVKTRTHFVELVQQDPPIVKIISRSEDHAARKAQKERARSAKMERKEIQMTWNVAESDIAHKLKKAYDELHGGNLVDVAIAPKARQILPKPQDMVDRMQLIADKLSDVAVERQERTLTRGGVGILFFRPDRNKQKALGDDS